MKKALLGLFVAAACLMTACDKKDKDAAEGYTLGIDVQSAFDQDHVQIYIDDRNVLDKTLTTNDLLGVCLTEGQITKLVGVGSHTLKVVINEHVTETNGFSMNKNLYVGIGYNPQTKDITFQYADHPFVYD